MGKIKLDSASMENPQTESKWVYSPVNQVGVAGLEPTTS